MRVLQILSSTAFHGAEAMAAELLRQLAPLGVENHVALLDNAGACDRHILEAASGSIAHSTLLPCAGALDAATFPALAKYVREHRIDVVHSHKYKTTFYALPVCRWTRCGLVSTYHNWVETTPALKFYGWLDRRLARFNDVSVGVSTPVVQTLSASVPAARLRQIDNGIDTQVFTPGADRRVGQAEFGFPQDALVLGCVGRLSKEKGVDRLLAALAQVPTDIAWGLIVVGDGELRTALQQQAQTLGLAGKVRFLGHRRDTAALYRLMDVFVLPSYLEAFPMALLEAMSSACAVVAADVGEVARILEGGRCGRLVRGTGPEEWVPALTETLRQRAQLSAMASAARERVVSLYSSAAMARAYLDAYELSQASHPAR
jgi:glycosyltransferase involved in cell wall biosynthesis